jgi:chemotaxis protein MotB
MGLLIGLRKGNRRMSTLRRRRSAFDIWPGFVDALTSLVMVMIFVLLIFAIGQFVLSDTLSGKNRALDALNARVAELAKTLSLAQDDKHALDAKVAELSASLGATSSERDTLKGQLDTATTEASKFAADIAALNALKQQLEAEVARLGAELDGSKQDLVKQTALTSAAAAQTELLNRQLAALNEQLGKIQAALDLANQDVKAKDAKIADLGKQLNLALAHKVGELERYRSEFFGKLRAALGDRSDIRIVGDRFVLPTDILFDTASAELGADAQARLARLADTVREVAAEIPSSIDWVLRIDGHTDKRPINTPRFPSNWELSTARAVAIVKYLVVQGIPAHRLSANGFGEFQPLDGTDSAEAWAKNRRIEIQLTNR